MKLYSDDDVRKALAEKARIYGIRGYARILDVPFSRLSESISGKRNLSPVVVRKAGFVVRYVKA